MTIEINENDFDNIIWALNNLEHVVSHDVFINEGVKETRDKLLLAAEVNKNDGD